MDPQVVDTKSEEPDTKRQRLEEVDKKCQELSPSYSDSSCSSDESEDYRRVVEEYKRSGAYDFDTTKQGRHMSRYPVVFENSDIAEEPETDGQLIDRLSKTALQKHNHERNTNLEFVRAVKVNWHYASGKTFYITFEAKDASQSELISFQARVGYFPWDITNPRVYEVKPKP